MDTSLFNASSPGELVAAGGGERAFLPAPLPPVWVFPADLWPLLSDAKQQIGVLEGIGRRLPNPELLLRPLQQREALRSSSLEGTYATPQELLLFGYDRPEARSEADPANAWREVFNYGTALEVGTSGQYPLTLSLLRELHEILLSGVRGRDKHPGRFRDAQVYLGHDMRFVPPPLQVPGCLEALERYLREPAPGYDPLVQCYLIHYQLETIHPFHDGNGRVGRLLLAIMLQRWCGLSKPWLYMSAFFDRFKDEYIDRLFAVSTRGAWREWIEYCLRGTVHQTLETIVRCERLLAVRDQFMARVAAAGGSIRLSQIVDGLVESPIVRIAELGRKMAVSYPTAKADVERLVSLGVLRELDEAKVKTFYSPEILHVAFDDIPAEPAADPE